MYESVTQMLKKLTSYMASIISSHSFLQYYQQFGHGHMRHDGASFMPKKGEWAHLEKT